MLDRYESSAAGCPSGSVLAALFHGSPHVDDCGRAYVLKVCIAALFTLPNLLRIGVVGRQLRLVGCAVVLPFVLLSAVGVYRGVDLSRLSEVRPWGEQTIQLWFALISSLYWNLGGWDCISTCAGEVIDPGRTYPRALCGAVGLTVLTYLVPLTVVSASNQSQYL